MNKQVKHSLLLTIVALFLATSVWGDVTAQSYCDYTHEKMCHQGTDTGRKIKLTWQTLPSGNVKISISEGEGSYYVTFRGQGFEGEMNGFKVVLLDGENVQTEEDASTYFSRPAEALVNNNRDFVLTRNSTALPEGKSLYAIRFYDRALAWRLTKEDTSTEDLWMWPSDVNDVNFVYEYGTTCDNADPVITAFSLTSVTETSATFHVEASDENTAGEDISDQLIYTITDATNGVNEIVSPDGSGNFTLSGLKKNRIYHFVLTVTDAVENTAVSGDVEAKLTYDQEYDIAFEKSCTAGAVQNDNVASRAVDGNSGTFWTCFGEPSGWWWQVDLGNIYDLSQVNIHFNDIWEAYSIYASVNNSDWTAIVEGATATADETKTYSSLTESARFLKVTSAGSHIGIKEFNVFGSDYAAADATNPTVSVSCTATTVNTATLQIIAADEDDAHNAGTITSIKITGDNGFVEQEVLSSLDGENKVTLSSLTYNTTYHFTVTAYDRAGNHASNNIEVVLPFNTELNLSLGRGDYCTAGATQGDNTPNKAVNGSTSDFWTSYDTGDAPSWWQVDLGTAYDVSRVVITFNDIAAPYNIEGSLNGTDWTTIVEGATASFGNTRTYSDLTMSAQYFKVTCPTSTRIGIKEFEVYATGFSVADDTDPTVAVTCPAKTVTSATLQIIAADKDDAGNAGTITSIKITGDNGFVEQEVLGSLVENQITLSGLKNNKTYHFTVTATDMAGNTGNDAIEVVLPFDTEYNIALYGTASAGFSEVGHGAAKANDGDAENADSQWNSYGVDASEGGYANNWWQVELDAEYNLSTIKIISKEAHNNQYVLEGSLDGSHYYKLAEGVISAVGTDEKTVAAPAQYMRFSCSNNYCSIYEFEVYASGFSTLTDSKPVVTYAKVGEVTDATAEIEIDAVDITTMPITTYMVSGLGGDPVEVTASEGKINLTSLSHSTNYSVSIQAKDGNGNLSDAKALAFTTEGGASGLYLHSDLYGWEYPDERERFSTTAEEGVMSYHVSSMSAADHIFKLYNADNTRCTWDYCGGESDHHFNLASATDVTFYATDEDHFVCTADNLYLRGTLVDEDKALVWNDAHTKATWSGTVDLSGTKQYTLVKNNGGAFVYDHDIYDAAQTYDGELTDVTFTFDATKMTGTWSEHAYPVTLDETIDNSTTISSNNGKLSDVTLNRGFVADGGNYTLCLPFNMTAEQCAEAFHDGYQLWYLEDSRLKDNGDIYLNFISADNIVAGRPYLFCPAENVTSGTVIENVRINSAASTASNSTYANFVGTYNKIPQATLNANNKAYLLGEDNWLFSAENLRKDMKALRAYFELNPDAVSNVHPRMRVVFNEPRTDMPTDVEEVEQVTAPAKRIVNGQLIIEKNGILYNAQGKRLQ